MSMKLQEPFLERKSETIPRQQGSIHSVDSCLIDILARREDKIFVPPSLRKIWIYLGISFAWTWTFAWLAVIWQHDKKIVKSTLDAMVDVSAPATLVAAFTVQYFADNDGGKEGCMKLIRRLHPHLISRFFWVVAIFFLPATYCVLNGLYTWFGGPPPETITFLKFLKLIGISLGVAILEEFGWRGIMLPDFQMCMDDWYFRRYGICSGNDGSDISFWTMLIGNAPPEGYTDLNRPNAASNPIVASNGNSNSVNSPVVNSAKRPLPSSQSRSGLLQSVREAGPNAVDDEVPVIRHWRMSPVVTSIAIGVFWAFWHLPLFFINDRAQTNSNFGQYLLQCIAFSFIYTWQSNGTNGSILAAIILHASINTFSELDPWGSEQYPNFLTQPNSWYTLEIYVIISLLLWTVGPALGRVPPKRVFA
jgi:membrane protease YdiL (CAAX protease family)